MKRYKIKKGWHYAFILFRRLGGWSRNRKTFLIRFKLSKECYWSPKRNPDDGDINKLIGISFGIFGVHKDSIRLGWKPDFDNHGIIEIYAYVYDKKSKVTIKRKITTVPVEQIHRGMFQILPNLYRISVNNSIIEIPNESPDKKIQKVLYPYFGGDNTAIRTMYFYQLIKPLR